MTTSTPQPPESPQHVAGPIDDLASQPNDPAESSTPIESRGPLYDWTFGLLKRLYAWVLSWAETPYGTPALAVVSFVESSFFPIPPDPLLMALAVGKPHRSYLYSAVCTVFSVLGGVLGYWIGYALFETIGEPILDFYHATEKFEAYKELFQTYGFLAVIIAAVTPIPYKVVTIASGTFGLTLPTFVIASVIGRGGRFFVEGLLIQFFGPQIRDLIDRHFEWAVSLFTVLLIGGLVLIKVVL